MLLILLINHLFILIFLNKYYFKDEVKRWRAGEDVPDEERACPKGNIVQSESSIREGAPSASTLLETTPTSSLTTPTPTQNRAFEEERVRLCQQLDEKVRTP